jgi:hypothetical protein
MTTKIKSWKRSYKSCRNQDRKKRYANDIPNTIIGSIPIGKKQWLLYLQTKGQEKLQNKWRTY